MKQGYTGLYGAVRPLPDPLNDRLLFGLYFKHPSNFTGNFAGVLGIAERLAEPLTGHGRIAENFRVGSESISAQFGLRTF